MSTFEDGYVKLFILPLLLAADALSATIPIACNKNARIIGGVPTSMVDIPYIVSITANGIHMCGGAIINKLTIITAAHCLTFWMPHELKVHAGARTHEACEGQLIDVRILYSHSLYSSDSMDYDLGLVRLESPLTYSATVQPIQLSQQNNIEGNVATVAGWGYLAAEGLEAEELNFAMVPIVDKETCNRLLPGQISERMICAGYLKGGIDACHKDSGGPLTAGNKLIGIVSWGDGCALPNKPGVYTHIAMLEPMVSKFMATKFKEYI